MHHDMTNPTVVAALIGTADWNISCSAVTETAVDSNMSRAVDTETVDGVDDILESGTWLNDI